MKLLLMTAVFACCAGSAAHATAGLYICAAHEQDDPEEWDFEFRKGSVLVPAGTVFDYAGHLMAGNLQDPKDAAHFAPGGWKGITKEENERRSRLVLEDASIDEKNTAGVITTKDITLTKAKPCALAPARTVLSEQWGWTVAMITGNAELYYQAYGVVRRGALDTGFSDDAVPVNQLGSRGELNASVRGTIGEPFHLDEWSAAQKPDELPVTGKGNAACWGDDTRQDISCRALTENFLLSMRGATKAEVVKAMNVRGREVEDGLHFVSNYAKGERWGSGDVNFLFGPDGRVSVITASLDPPNMAGKSVDFIWNAERLPMGCSDLPNSRMRRCDGL